MRILSVEGVQVGGSGVDSGSVTEGVDLKVEYRLFVPAVDGTVSVNSKSRQSNVERRMEVVEVRHTRSRERQLLQRNRSVVESSLLHSRKESWAVVVYLEVVEAVKRTLSTEVFVDAAAVEMASLDHILMYAPACFVRV